MPRQGGWDYAQLKATFAGDPEFRSLFKRSRGKSLTYYAACGLWMHAFARAWAEDDPDVSDVLADEPALTALLEDCGLIQDGTLRGFAKWTDAVRRVRQADADRKRQDKPGAQPTPPESHGVPRNGRETSRVVGVVVGDGVGEEVSLPGTHDARVPLQRLAEELTQKPYALPNMTARLGEMALEQVESHGFPAVERAWRAVASSIEGRPTIRQIVLGADDRLNPIPRSDSKAAAKEDRADLKRRLIEGGRNVA